MAYEESYQKFSTDNLFTGRLDLDGTIYNANMRGVGTKVGIDAEREQELLNQISEQEEIIKNYYDKLVSLGVIEVPKTPEEIALEQAAAQATINQQLLEAIGALNTEIKELKGANANGNSGYGIEDGREPDKQNSTDNRKVTARNKGSNKSGQTATSTDNE